LNRTKSSDPKDSSMRLKAMLSVGWLTVSRVAARETLPCRATSRK